MLYCTRQESSSGGVDAASSRLTLFHRVRRSPNTSIGQPHWSAVVSPEDEMQTAGTHPNSKPREAKCPLPPTEKISGSQQSQSNSCASNPHTHLCPSTEKTYVTLDTPTRNPVSVFPLHGPSQGKRRSDGAETHRHDRAYTPPTGRRFFGCSGPCATTFVERCVQTDRSGLNCQAEVRYEQDHLFTPMPPFPTTTLHPASRTTNRGRTTTVSLGRRALTWPC